MVLICRGSFTGFRGTPCSFTSKCSWVEILSFKCQMILRTSNIFTDRFKMVLLLWFILIVSAHPLFVCLRLIVHLAGARGVRDVAFPRSYKNNWQM